MSEKVKKSILDMENRQKGELVYLPIDCLVAHQDNPRKDLGDLSELAESIKAKGIMQNLTVVKSEGFEELYTVIIGHRRMAAARMAGLKEVPCVIAEMTHQEQIATMLLENMQRNDLTVYEQAKGFQLMMDLGESVETVAEMSGFSPSTIRRRVKLLELDESKFKKSEERGANLFDYIELEKIKDLKLKNKVLDSIGTENFKYELRKAIEKERNKEKLDAIESCVQKFAKKVSSTNGLVYEKAYSTWTEVDDVSSPDDCDTTEYFYSREDRYIYLYTKKDESADEQKRKQEEEILARKKQKEEQLREVTKRAFELRSEFANNVTATCVKKNFAEILAYWMYQEAYDSSYVDEEEVLEMLGISADEEAEDERGFSYEDVLASVKQNPEVKLWRMICVCIGDNERWSYYSSWKLEHKENKELSEWYDLLCKLGYEMSNEEKALRDGTHELFA